MRGADRVPGPGIPVPVPEPPGPDLVPEPAPLPDPQPPDVEPSPDPQIPPDPRRLNFPLKIRLATPRLTSLAPQPRLLELHLAELAVARGRPVSSLAAVTRVPVLGAGVARNRVSLAALYPYVMSEAAENSDGTVRRIGRPFQPGVSGNPGGRPKGVARAFRDALGGSPSEAAQGLLELARTAPRPADRIAAWREILDPGWGKAPMFASIEGADSFEHDEISREIRAIPDQLERERDAS